MSTTFLRNGNPATDRAILDSVTLEDILEDYPEVTGIHPACLIIPDISREDFYTLCDDIGGTGLRHAIVLTEKGELIDGRNRLLACYHGQIEPRFEKTATDPYVVAISENFARRHLTVGQKVAIISAYRAILEPDAKKQKSVGGAMGGKRSGAARRGETKDEATLPQASKRAPQTRDKLADLAGVGGKAVDKYRTIEDEAPDVAKEVANGTMTLEKGYKEAAKRKRQKKTHPIEAGMLNGFSKSDLKPMTEIVKLDGSTIEIPKPKNVRFNATTNAVDWAAWTWNPITGCEHGCPFCYAREIANKDSMKEYYPARFDPVFHPYRLAAPANTPVPRGGEPQDGRVFVCSMADLFGKWVPTDWIKQVFDACLAAPEWKYLFLTKWPARYARMPLLADAWYGASVTRQADVQRVEKAMKDFEATGAIKWISCEPMLGPVVFEDLAWCDLMVIGSQTATTQPDGFVPAFAPKLDWVVDLINQCREAGVPYYCKANLGHELPGMELPKMLPRGIVR